MTEIITLEIPGVFSGDFFTDRTMDSYSIHSFDSAFHAVTELPRQSAGNERPPVHAGI